MAQKNNYSQDRKKDHIKICLNEDVGFINKTSGFEKYEFQHFAATEVDFDTIDLKTNFLNKPINLPFIISCMTGGTNQSIKINEELAASAQELNIPIGVGSQRQLLKSSDKLGSFQIIRKIASSVPVISNIGAAQVAQMNDYSILNKIIDVVEADALAIHLNPSQELFQIDGDTNFAGLLNSVENIVKELHTKVIIKEVGAGISKQVARNFLNIGVSAIDVAGAGGTSWSAVEIERSGLNVGNYFKEWGIPTAQCLKSVNKLRKKFTFSLIASGGIDNGIKIAKSFALGADFVASAGPLLKSVVVGGSEAVNGLILDWFDTVKKIMYLTNCNNLSNLKELKLKKTKA